MINGLFADLNSYCPMLEHFEKSYNILRYDCRGQGKSTKPNAPYLLEDHVEDLKGLLDKYSISQALFLGMSNGGRIILKFNELYPGMVLVNACAATYANPSELLKVKLYSWLSACENGGPGHRFDVALPWIWGETFYDNNSSIIDSYRDNACNTTYNTTRNLIIGALESKIDLTKIKAPTLILVGNEDLLTTPTKHEEIYKTIFESNNQKSEYKELNGGHALFIENPIESSIEIIKFFNHYGY